MLLGIMAKDLDKFFEGRVAFLVDCKAIITAFFVPVRTNLADVLAAPHFRVFRALVFY